jgi:aminoglycoside 6'-N-acetyltransferase I
MVRRAAPADLTAAVRLAAALWPDEPKRDHREHLAAVLAGKPRSTLPLIVLLAEVRKKVVGFLEVGLRSHADGCDGDRPVGFIEGWFVVKDQRRRGVGKALMLAAENWARQQGCREIASDTWLDNEPSQRVHEALGFEVVDRCINYRKAIRP